MKINGNRIINGPPPPKSFVDPKLKRHTYRPFLTYKTEINLKDAGKSSMVHKKSNALSSSSFSFPCFHEDFHQFLL